MVRSVVALLCALCILPAGAQAFAKKALTFDVLVGPSDDQPCSIVADLYIPDGADAANPVPAILGTNGFGGSKDNFADLGPAFAKRGYAFLAYSGLGFGGSSCRITLDDRDYDGKAGSQLVSFLGGTKAARDGTKVDFVVLDKPGDPRVGMFGGSYGGQIQFAIAGIDDRLDALVPQITWNDLAYSLTPNDTDFESGVSSRTPGVAKLDWPLLFFGIGIGQGMMAAFSDPSHLGSCPNFADQVCPSLLQAGATGYPDEPTLALLRHVSVATFTDRIKVPTLLSQGESDNLFFVNEAVATYRALLAQGTPVKLVWRSFGHSGGGIGRAESDFTDLEAGYESRMALEWFDWYLRGVGDPPQLNFNFFTDWLPYKDDAAPAVGSTPSYPAGADAPLYLSGDGTLVRDRGAVTPGSATIAVVPQAPTSAGGGVADTGAYDADGASAAFVTPPLTEDLDVVGIPRLTLAVSAPSFAGTQGAGPAGQLVLFAKLYDVDPSGEASLPRNLVAAVRVPDVGKPVAIELPGIAHRFARGHRLRLVIASSSASYHNALQPGLATLALDGAAALTLPLVGAEAGARGSGPGGTTPFEPSLQALPVQRAGAGGPPRGAPAARLPRRCAARRTLRLRLRPAPHGDRLRSAVLTVDGRRVKTVRGRALRRPVVLRVRHAGAIRVVVTARTVRGRTLRSARSYRACARGRDVH